MPISSYSHSANQLAAGSLADINDFDIFLLYLSLEMHIAHRSLIPEATVAVSPGARARSLLLAALIIIIIIIIIIIFQT